MSAQQGAVQAGTGSATTWVIDPAHSTIEFGVRHLMITTVKGYFEKVEGKLVGDPEDPTGASVDVSIDAASVDTRNPDRDNHLRSADFFDVANHPQITFRSRRIEPTGEGRYKVVGDLTIRGVTREVTLDAVYEGQMRDPWGGERIAFSAQAKLNRKDFNLNWNTVLETGGVLVGDEVTINLNVQAVRQG